MTLLSEFAIRLSPPAPIPHRIAIRCSLLQQSFQLSTFTVMNDSSKQSLMRKTAFIKCAANSAGRGREKGEKRPTRKLGN